VPFEIMFWEFDSYGETLDSDDNSCYFLEDFVVHAPLAGHNDAESMRAHYGAIENGDLGSVREMAVWMRRIWHARGGSDKCRTFLIHMENKAYMIRNIDIVM